MTCIENASFAANPQAVNICSIPLRKNTTGGWIVYRSATRRSDPIRHKAQDFRVGVSDVGVKV